MAYGLHRQHHAHGRLDRRSGGRQGLQGDRPRRRGSGTPAAGVLDVISSRRERDDVERLGALDPGVPWDTVLFTAKEAAYKAWFPMTGIVLSHDDIEVRLARDARFTAVARAGTAAGPRSGLGVRGQWARAHGRSSVSQSLAEHLPHAVRGLRRHRRQVGERGLAQPRIEQLPVRVPGDVRHGTSKSAVVTAP